MVPSQDDIRRRIQIFRILNGLTSPALRKVAIARTVENAEGEKRARTLALLGATRSAPGQRYRHGWIPISGTLVVGGLEMPVAYREETYPGETGGAMRHWEVTDAGGKVVSDLWADRDTGQIMQVHTVPERRGEGIASALYRYASGHVQLYHSPDAHRTPEGNGWARAVGGDTIPDDLAFDPGYEPDEPDDDW